ncbi:sugar kinase [Ethanoligenens sp.]|uniref:sugar kinase n=1 Tax=Ethanoligenens sp. TaxID=2099655 RepID=UPI0039E972F0
MSNILLIGEPMVMFIAQTEGKLEDVQTFTRDIAGAEVNVGVGLRRLGHQVSYLTRLGNDPLGKYIRNFLSNEQIDISHIQWDNAYPTGFQLKQKALNPMVAYFRKRSAASMFSLDDLKTVDITQYDHLHLTGIFPALSENTLKVTVELARRAREHGLSITYDPNLRPSLWPDEPTMVRTINELAPLCDYILPGIHEGKILTGLEDEKSISDFYLNLGVKGVIIKLGPDGAYFQTADHQAAYLPPFREDRKVDTVGAGDGFAAGVISALLDHLSLAQAVERGNAIGTMQIMSPYDNKDLPDRPTLEAFMSTHRTQVQRRAVSY